MTQHEPHVTQLLCCIVENVDTRLLFFFPVHWYALHSLARENLTTTGAKRGFILLLMCKTGWNYSLRDCYCISIKNDRLYQALLSDHCNFIAMVVSSLIDRFRASLLYCTVQIGLWCIQGAFSTVVDLSYCFDDLQLGLT